MKKSERDKLRWLTAGVVGFIAAIILTVWLGIGIWGFIAVFALTTVGGHRLLLGDEAAQVTIDSQDGVRIEATEPVKVAEPSKGLGIVVKTLLIAIAILAPLAILGVVVGHNEKEKAVQEQLATQRAEDAERNKETQTKLAEEAAKKGMSVEDYLEAQTLFEFNGYIKCVLAVKKQARWGAESDSIPKAGWAMRDDRKMLIRGNDIRMKNGFNAERYVEYACLYDPEKRTVEVLSVD